MNETIRVLIVDDSAFMRRALERMLAESPAVSVVATAANGEEAVTLACRLRPHVIVMDVDMPRMDGLEALRRVMQRCPVPVLMMSTLTRAGAEVTLRALELGAVDFIDKTSAGTAMDIYSLAPSLRDKVIAVARAEVAPAPAPTAAPESVEAAVQPPRPSVGRYEVIAIGASTGGPRALSEIVPRLPADLGAAVIIAQHMPAGFTTTLAERLDDRSAVAVGEAKDGDALVPGRVLIAPGGMQTRVERDAGQLVARVTRSSRQQLHHPSIDLLFESIAEAAGAHAVGVVLTGMGHDGAQGLSALQRAGARTLAESPETAVIYGMPRAARAAADELLPLYRVAPVLIELCGQAAQQQETR